MIRNVSVLLISGLVASCGQEEDPASDPVTAIEYQGIQFCDIAERRRFSVEEYQWREENAAWNLRKDLRHNQNMEEFCPDEFKSQGPGA